MAATIVFGTEQADFLLGNNLIDPSLLYDEIFFALGGDDIVSGGLERDFVWAGSGNDTVDLGSGNDKGVGQEGNDIIVGGEGNDILDMGAGSDRATGGNGDDWIFGGDGSDFSLAGDSQNDVIYGDLIGTTEIGNDSLFGGDGNDILIGGPGDDNLLGGADNDWLAGNEGNDQLNGGTGQDILVDDEGNDFVFGGTDNDRDTIILGAGSDVVLTSGLAGERGETAFAGVDVVWNFNVDEDWISVNGADWFGQNPLFFTDFITLDGLSGTLIETHGQGLDHPVIFLAGVDLSVQELNGRVVFNPHEDGTSFFL
jgi:Ca2+-binding RTX toxin-like protein